MAYGKSRKKQLDQLHALVHADPGITTCEILRELDITHKEFQRIIDAGRRNYKKLISHRVDKDNSTYFTEEYALEHNIKQQNPKSTGRPKESKSESDETHNWRIRRIRFIDQCMPRPSAGR